ncbi:hypothetical protein CTAYLR_005726 [Chrysophaeum taylorii]|uniref:RanBP2-type domain-containing protein n=1 Tax=Chrysophaeum taylorii TaxID=2483200 RepID=A0AAD7UJJ6_9STRA|nr:hypothetical protein CTAYLR_005726 [Chrysophaeum taylorii]
MVTEVRSGVKRPRASSTWACAVCTFENSTRCKKCAMCKTRREEPTPDVATTDNARGARRAKRAARSDCSQDDEIDDEVVDLTQEGEDMSAIESASEPSPVASPVQMERGPAAKTEIASNLIPESSRYDVETEIVGLSAIAETIVVIVTKRFVELRSVSDRGDETLLVARSPDVDDEDDEILAATATTLDSSNNVPRGILVTASRLRRVVAYNFARESVYNGQLEGEHPCATASAWIAAGDYSTVVALDGGLWRFDRLSSSEPLDVGVGARVLDARYCQGFDKGWTMALVRADDGLPHLRVWDDEPSGRARRGTAKRPPLLVVPLPAASLAFAALECHVRVPHEADWGRPLAAIAALSAVAEPFNDCVEHRPRFVVVRCRDRTRARAAYDLKAVDASSSTNTILAMPGGRVVLALDARAEAGIIHDFDRNAPLLFHLEDGSPIAHIAASALAEDSVVLARVSSADPTVLVLSVHPRAPTADGNSELSYD